MSVTNVSNECSNSQNPTSLLLSIVTQHRLADYTQAGQTYLSHKWLLSIRLQSPLVCMSSGVCEKQCSAFPNWKRLGILRFLGTAGSFTSNCFAFSDKSFRSHWNRHHFSVLLSFQVLVVPLLGLQKLRNLVVADLYLDCPCDLR